MWCMVLEMFPSPVLSRCTALHNEYLTNTKACLHEATQTMQKQSGEIVPKK